MWPSNQKKIKAKDLNAKVYIYVYESSFSFCSYAHTYDKREVIKMANTKQYVCRIHIYPKECSK